MHPLRTVTRSGVGACLLIAPLALATGCGSSKKATTAETTSASVPTGATGATGTTGAHPTTGPTHATSTPATAPSNGNGGTAGPPLAPGQHPPTTTPQNTISIPKSREEQIRRELRRLREHPAPKPAPTPTLARVPRAKQFPAELRTRFMTQCKSAGESTGKCECLIAKFEEAAVAKEQSIAEFVYFEASRHRGIPQPKRIRERVAACARA
jgi:hypothetical protein